MLILTDQIVSITEANQNFNQVLKKARANGDIIIFKRNKPAYILIDIDTVGEQFLNLYTSLKELNMKKERNKNER